MRLTRFLAVLLASTLQLSAAQTLVDLVFPTLTELGAYNITTYQTNLTAQVLGQATIADGSAAMWYFAPNSVAVVDGTTVIASTGVAGRWLIAPSTGIPGTGDVVGPAGATDGNLVTFDGITGKLIQDSGVAISDITGLVPVATLGNLATNSTTATMMLVTDPNTGGTFSYSATAPLLSDSVRLVDGFVVSGSVATVDTVILHGFTNGASITISGATLAVTDGTTSATATSGSTKTITAITVTAANSATVTVAAHGWLTGATVTIASVPEPWDLLNAAHTITVGADPNTFTITGVWPLINTAHTITVVDADTFTITCAINDGNIAGATVLATAAWREIPGIAYVRVAGGYWLRQYNGVINPVWLGLVSDGSALLPQAQSNTYALNRALALRNPNYYPWQPEVKVPLGQYCFSDTIHLNDKSKLIGSGREGTVFYRQASGSAVNPMIKISGVRYGASLSSLTLTPIATAFLWDFDGVYVTKLRGVGCQKVYIDDLNIYNCDNGIHLYGAATDYTIGISAVGIYCCDIRRIFMYACNYGARTSSASGTGGVNNVWWNAITASACNVNGIKNEVGSNFFEGVSIEFAGASPIVDSSITSSYNNFWIEDNNVGSLVFTGGSVKWGYGVLGANVTITVDDSTEFVCDGFNGSQTLGIVKEYPNDGIQFPRGQMAGPYASTANGTRYAFDGGRAATVIGEYGYGLNFTTNAAGAAFITWPYTGSAADLQSDWSAVIAHDTTSFATSGNTTLFAMGPALNDEYIRLAEVGGGINAYIIVPSLTTNHVLNATWWRTSNVAQVTTSVPHNFTTGQNVIVRGLFGATAATGITATPGTTTFSFASVGADGSGSFAASQYSYRRVAVIYSDMPYTSSQGSGLHWLGMAYDASDKLLLVTNGRVTSEYYVDFSNADKTALAVRNYGANGTGTYTTTVPYYGFWNRALTLGEMLTVMNEQQHRQGDVLPLVPNLVFDAGYTPTLSGASQVGLYSALDGSSKAQLYTVNSDGYVNQLSGNVGVGTNAPTAQLVVVSQNTEPAIVLENDFFSAGIQTNIVGNVRGAGAVDLQYGRNTATMVASGRSSFIGGGTNNTASGIASAAVGGDRNKSSGYYSFAAGANNTASGDGTVAFGNGSSASGSYSMATGVQSLSTLYGQYSRASGYFTSAGDAQMSILNARALMTNATSTVKNLYLEGASGKLVIPASSTWGMRVEIVGRANTGESGYYVINALVERDAANDATIVGQTAAPVMWEDDAAWDAILVQDDAAGAITITVTGNNETTIRWVATVYLTQVRG